VIPTENAAGGEFLGRHRVSAAPIRVDDPSDPRLSDYVSLTDPGSRRWRESDEFFVAEGPTAIERLVASGHRIRSVLLADTKYERLAPIVAGVDAPVYLATRDVLAATVGFDIHRGAVAAADRRPHPALADLLPSVRRIAVLEGLNDPENLGAIARSARALGIEALVLDPTCIDPYYRRTVRVSMGEILFLPVARSTRWPDDLDVISAAGFETWAMTPAPDAVDLWDLAVPDRLAVVLGAEGPGLADSTLRRTTRRVRIPIADGVDSLNVGAAAAITFAATGSRRAG
jgi:tRNA G18 (ribose-2'-O)-methylase SpoU